MSWHLTFTEKLMPTKSPVFSPNDFCGTVKEKTAFCNFNSLKSSVNQAGEPRKGRQKVKYRIPAMPHFCKYIMSAPVTYWDMTLDMTYWTFNLSLCLAVFDAASEDNPGVASCFSSAAVNTSPHRARCVQNKMGSPISHIKESSDRFLNPAGLLHWWILFMVKRRKNDKKRVLVCDFFTTHTKWNAVPQLSLHEPHGDKHTPCGISASHYAPRLKLMYCVFTLVTTSTTLHCHTQIRIFIYLYHPWNFPDY